MTTTLEVIYEDGIFKPVSSVPKTFKEHERMKIIIETNVENQSKDKELSQEILREMLAEGMISRIPEGINDEENDFEPIKTKGKPFSETLLEDRN